MNPIIDMLKHAMQAERDGFYHYRNASERTEDEKARDVFDKLAHDELVHHKMLEETLAAVEKGTSTMDIPSRAKGPSVDLSGPSPIYSEGFKSKIKDKHSEMSALSIGMTLEQNGIDFYGDMERKAQDPEIKKMAAFLVEWEKSHLAALAAQVKLFQEYNWQEANFAPF